MEYEEEARVSGSLNPRPEKEKEDVGEAFYWLDACEDDMSCHFIDDFVDLDAAAISEAGLDPCLFGGIDQILDSIKNGGSLPVAGGPPKMEQVLEDSIRACPNTNYSNRLLNKFYDDTAAANKNNYNGGQCPSNNNSDAAAATTETCKHHYETNTNTNSSGNDNKSSNHSPERNGVRSRLEETRGTDDLYRDQDRDQVLSEGRRSNKRARVNDYNYKTERHFQNRGGGGGQYHPRERERLKRPRNWEADIIDRRERDHITRRERYGSGKKREGRESKGFWERERPGSNEMVFRLGSWESERNREGKAPSERNQDCIAKVEKKPEEAKEEKLPQEQARQYQLDVLEQAKQKNTIAFLETGAGKTLIAVLLIKSVCSDLQIQNKRMLAVFLVPKVPLVYQQAEVIRERTGYQVGHYRGEMGQDFWDARRWQHEFETKQPLPNVNKSKDSRTWR